LRLLLPVPGLRRDDHQGNEADPWGEAGMTDSTPRHILVVDDDNRVRTLLSWQLEAAGFAVRYAADGTEALDRIGRDRPDLVILDLSLPGVGGLDVLRSVRQHEPAGATPLPVIILSGRSGETDRIVGLDFGADDYLVKPFSPGELAARVRSVLRRARPPDGPPGGPGAGSGPEQASPAADLRIDEAAREVFARGRPVDLTAREYDLLAFLARHPRQVFTRAQLLRSVWDSEAAWQSEATVTEHVHRLRVKLEDDPARPHWLHTVRGVGYRMDA
jgi:two-component system phosphate regulon response regulator PhoB